MKKFLFLTCLIFIVLIISFVSLSAASIKGDANNDGVVDVADITAIAAYILNPQSSTINQSNADINGDGVIDVADITATATIILSGGEVIKDNTVYVNYNGTIASVKAASNISPYLTIKVDGADVSIVADTTLNKEINYILSGTTTDGMFYMDSEYKSTLTLNGVNITNADGSAIQIDCGKRIAVIVADSTENTLVDGTKSKKAAFFINGHAEFEGGGILNITGNSKHAYRSDEYTQLKKKFTGTINILGAPSDGMHVGQYFQMNNGNLIINGVEGDGLQSEATGDNEEDDGQIIIKGGIINITTTGIAAKGMKSDSLISISGGELTFTQSGQKEQDEETDDLSYVTAIKSGSNISITGGSVTINNTAEGGKGISADGNISITDGLFNITTNGTGDSYEKKGSTTPTASYKLYVSVPTTTGGGGGGPGGGGQQPPGGGGTPYWSNIYLYNSNNVLIATLTKTTVFTTTSGTSTTFYYYDFGQAMAQGTYYLKSDDYNDRGRNYTIRSGAMTFALSGSNIFYSVSSYYSTSGTIRTFSVSNVTSTYANATSGGEANTYSATGFKADGNITIDGGTYIFNHSGAMSKGIKCDSLFTINNGTFTFNTSGTSKAYNNDPVYCTAIKTNDFVQNGGSITVKATGIASRGISVDNDMTINDATNTITCSGAGVLLGSYDSYDAKGYCVNGNLQLLGGTHTITCTGKGGKGINVDGTAIFGTTTSCPIIKVTTSGAATGGSGENLIGTAKAIKVQGSIDVENGDLVINTSTSGAEGIESKSYIIFDGGKFYAKCYDDCINSRGNLKFNGTYVYAYSNGNDAIDCNNNISGGITINGGAVFCYSTKGSPEEGLDIDNLTNVVCNGGYLFAAGGRQSSTSSLSSSSQQTYGLYTSSVSFTTGRYYTVTNNSGTTLFTVKFPTSCNSQLTMITAPGLTKSSTNYVKYGTTAPISATSSFNDLIWIGGTVTTTANQFSFTGK